MASETAPQETKKNQSVLQKSVTKSCSDAVYPHFRKQFHATVLSLSTEATIPPQRESAKDYRRITCEKGKYLAKQPPILRNEPTSSQKTMNQTVKTMHRIALVFAMGSCMKMLGNPRKHRECSPVFCNGVVIDLLHFNSEKGRCQGHLKRIIVTSLCWKQTRTMFGSFFFSKRNLC